MHYRCIAGKPERNASVSPKDVFIRHAGQSPTSAPNLMSTLTVTSSVREMSEEDACLVSEIELNELPENPEVSKI